MPVEGSLPHKGAGRPGVPRVKTVVPRLPSGFVHRPRLLAALDSAAPEQITLVSAPAGYGKTLLLAAWAAARPEATGWVSLDADDNDDHRFWSAVMTALASCAVPPVASALQDLLVPSRPSEDPSFLAAVENALDLVPSSVRLILDDVHELIAPGPLHGLTAFARDRPPGLQLVLASRTDPPMALSRLRVARELVEIRAGQLRFSVPEADAMLAAADVAARPDQVQLLVEQTEGWAAGLMLAALSLRAADDADRFLSDFVGNSRAVSDYLVVEILAHLPAKVLDVLEAVSVCDQLSAPLAEALSGRADAGEVLDSLERETFLVLSFGRGRTWYRVHPLLRSHLLADLHRRHPSRVQDLHLRAADWYIASGQPVEALGQARQAGDPDRVAELLRANTIPLIVNGLFGTLREALKVVGDRHVAGDPWLALVAALVEIESGALVAADDLLATADAHWPTDPAGGLAALRALVHARRVGMTGLAPDMIRATEALSSVPADEPALVVLGTLDRALALVTAGRWEESEAVAGAALTRAQQVGQGHLAARAHTVLGAIAGTRGDYPRMVQMAERADAEVQGTDWDSMGAAAFTSSMRSLGALLRADPAACLELLRPARTFFAGAPPPPSNPVAVTVHAVRGAALADLGRSADGLEELRLARTVARGQGVAPTAISLIALLEHGTANRLGRQDVARAALEWAEEELGDCADLVVMRAHRQSGLGRHQAARDLLRSLEGGSLRAYTAWVLVEGHVLDCRLAVLADHRSRAVDSLARALRAAQTSDAVRPLALGPVPVVDLLTRQLGSFESLEPIARRVLDARNALGADVRPVSLTDRERAVLRLLPTQRSFDEIADHLTVSRSTVKTHVRAIYGKLGVNARRDAVDRARRSGLLVSLRSPDEELG